MQPALGRQLRELREQAGLGLVDVAKKCGVSKSFLSLVETGQSDLSVNRFLRICEFYGVKPSAVLQGEAAGSITGEAPHFFSPSEGSEIISLRPPGAGSALLPALTVYSPGARTEEFSHAGEEFVFVIEGRIRLVLDGRKIMLKERDSYYFSAETPHRFENPDRAKQAVKLSVQSEDRW